MLKVQPKNNKLGNIHPELSFGIIIIMEQLLNAIFTCWEDKKISYLQNIIQEFNNNEIRAIQALDNYVDHLARGLSLVCNILDPDIIG